MKLVESNKLENSRHELVVSVGAEEFKPAVDKAFKQNIKKISIPGFRKGKAPRHMVEKMFGEGIFYEDAVNALYPAAYEQALEEAGVEPVDRADIEITDVNAEGFTFKATFTVKPEVTVKDYKGIKAEKVAAVVTDEELEAEVTRLREQAGRMVDVDDRAAQNGDTANINFEGFADGVAFEGGKGEDYPLVLGAGQFIPGFEEQIVGKAIGEEFDVNVTFPEEYHAPELAGKPAVFKCKLNSLKVRELPELDDEFAKDISEFDTLEELKKDISAKVLERKEERSKADLENDLVSAIIEKMEGEIPQVMIDNRCEDMVQDFGYRLQSQGLNLEAYFQYTNSTVEDMKASFAEQATRQVKVRLALEKIAELENLTVADAEVEEYIEKMAKDYGMEVAKLKELLPPAETKNIMEELKVQKAIDLVRDNAVVTEVAAKEEKPAKKPAAKKTSTAKKPAAKKTTKKEEAAE
ncbi:MAG: trigger factor [Oscillospiraceae bacterium]|nr:trigger factor [Oscillospiraceae bacterium]